MSNERSGQESEVEQDGSDTRVIKIPRHGSVKIITEISVVAHDGVEITSVHKPIGMIAIQEDNPGPAKNGNVLHGYPFILIIQFYAATQDNTFTLDVKDPDTVASPQKELLEPIQMSSSQDIYAITYTPRQATTNGITFTLFDSNGNPCLSPFTVVIG